MNWSNVALLFGLLRLLLSQLVEIRQLVTLVEHRVVEGCLKLDSGRLCLGLLFTGLTSIGLFHGNILSKIWLLRVEVDATEVLLPDVF